MPTIERRGKPRYKAVVQVNGKRKEKRFPDDSRDSKRAALKWEMEMRELLQKEQEKQTPMASSPSILTWATAYLDHVNEQLSPRTYEEKRASFKRLIGQFGKNKPVDELGDRDVLRFLTHQNRTRSGYGANRDRKNLAAAWKYGRKYMNHFPRGENPFLEADRFPEQRQKRYVPPEEDFWKVYAQTEGQDRVMLLTFLHLGARKGEVFNMKVEDLDFKNLTVTLWTSKREGGNREYDLVPLIQTLARELLWWLQNTRVNSEYVFVNQSDHHYSQDHWGKPFTSRQHWIHAVCRRAGIKQFTWHAIRHLTASILYQEGQSVSVIQRILRNRLIGCFFPGL